MAIIDFQKEKSARAEPARAAFNEILAGEIEAAMRRGVSWQEIVEDLLMYASTIGGGWDCDETSAIVKRWLESEQLKP
jgi:hypothetical protein